MVECFNLLNHCDSEKSAESRVYQITAITLCFFLVVVYSSSLLLFFSFSCLLLVWNLSDCCADFWIFYQIFVSLFPLSFYASHHVLLSPYVVCIKTEVRHTDVQFMREN